MNSLGVPALGSPEAAAFWLSFWPSFWSGTAAGVISSLLTGLIVGYILVHYQKGVAARALAESYALDLSVKLDPLRKALTQQDVLSIVSAVQAAPPPVLAAVSVLQNTPLTVWHEALPKHRQLIAKAIELQKSLTSFTGLAAEVDQILQQQVRAFNHSRGAISANDPVYFQYAVGTIFGASGLDLLPWLASNGPDVLEAYETAWARISLNNRLIELIPLVQKARTYTKESASALLAAIDA